MSNLWLTWDELNNRAKDCELICFGAGNRMQRTLKYLVKMPEFCVDNNPYEIGTVEAGIPVRDPGVLEKPGPTVRFIVITTTGFLDVKVQLESYGYVEGVHFCVSPVLRDFAVLDRIANHKQTIYFTCSDPYNKRDKRGGLYILEIPDGKITQIVGGHCHGLATDGDLLYLVNDTVGGVEILNGDQSIGILELPEYSRPHGLAVEDNLVAVALSGIDSVQIFRDKKPMCRFSISGKQSTTGLPEHHINDVCLCNETLYVSMFSLSGNWKRGIFDGAIVEHIPITGEGFTPVVTGAWLPHTPRIIGGILHYCESMAGKVYKGRELLATFTGFVRGIDFDGQFYYVGQSQHRHITRRLGASNISLDTGIFILDPETRCTKFYPTPSLTDINAVLVKP